MFLCSCSLFYGAPCGLRIKCFVGIGFAEVSQGDGDFLFSLSIIFGKFLWDPPPIFDTRSDVYPSVESNVSLVELFKLLSCAACKCRVELRYRKSLLRGHYAYWVYDGHIGTSYILPSGSNSVEILRILRLFWVQVPQCQPINQFCPYFEGYKIAFDIFWLSTVSGTGIYNNHGILLAAILY